MMALSSVLLSWVSIDSYEKQMLFNSIEFAFFLPIVFAIYWALNDKGLRWQNVFLLLASYAFYGWWDKRFLALIVVSTLLDFLVGRALLSESRQKYRKLLLGLSLSINLGMLAYFKYYNFFLDNLKSSVAFLGFDIQLESLNVILPVGISFYTFQTLSYSIDVYKGRIQPTKSFLDFAVFVSFFPQLVAGPIERAKDLLPQLQQKRRFDLGEASIGMRQILWGLFKKLVIADNCAIYVTQVFNSDPYTYSSLELFAVSMLIPMQFYCDFSGYSDIAIGVARLFGVRLSPNFHYPFFTKSIGKLWQKWHISLSSWVRDYLYIPLGRMYKGKWWVLSNYLISFVAIGLWHGAGWPFFWFGVIHALLVASNALIWKKTKIIRSISFGAFHGLLLRFRTYLFFSLTTAIFMAPNMQYVERYFFKMLSFAPSPYIIDSIFDKSFFGLMRLILAFIAIEWISRKGEFPLQVWAEKVGRRPLRWAGYLFLVFLIYYYGVFEETEFTYFVF